MSVGPRLYFFKRSNGFYYILIRESGHRRWRSTGAKRKDEALQALWQFQDSPKLQEDRIRGSEQGSGASALEREHPAC